MFIKENLSAAVSRWELCAFNNLCVDKYDGLGIDWRFRETDPMTRDDACRLARIAQDSGVDASIVHLSGPMKNVITSEPSVQVMSDRGGPL
jgi:pyruvate formate lyase activating enzyme